MLPKQENKIDIDGYAMLLLSTLVVIATAGLSYVLCLRKIFLTAKNETHYCDNDVMVFVLGKKLQKNKPDYEYVQRLKRANAILNEDDDSQVIILGGKTGDAIITEAHAGKDFLEKFEIDPLRIHLEQTSRNTLENIRNAISFLKIENKKIVIVSNRYHLARAKQMANGFGLEVELCAAEEKLSMDLLLMVKLMTEALHVHWYLTGKYWARITNNKNMLSRIS
ncbi:MAG: YdcF family protein [Gammaproteobacteria bacterium]|nr:YdcF family protein [Gammaproteobacteria bacterium]MCW8986265.1 YdcF family protein [Gammaproteobacteria bacterium]MCW9031685.1 YdcF family protein [Gammaproteobacteria bacterium]